MIMTSASPIPATPTRVTVVNQIWVAVANSDVILYDCYYHLFLIIYFYDDDDDDDDVCHFEMG